MADDAPKIFAVVPTYNEEHRYLQACLQHLQNEVGVDMIMVYDDRSTDYTAATATDILFRGTLPWYVHRRDIDEISFSTHEGYFRRAMLKRAVEVCHPRPGIDWILVNDADEFLATPLPVGINKVLRGIVEGVETDSLLFGLDELWQLDPPMRRVDKAWATITNKRLFRYREGSLDVSDAAWATGSIPEYAHRSTEDVQQAVRIVHAGYAVEEDREPKWQRHAQRDGHSTVHVASILDKRPWLNELPYCPKIWRGER